MNIIFINQERENLSLELTSYSVFEDLKNHSKKITVEAFVTKELKNNFNLQNYKSLIINYDNKEDTYLIDNTIISRLLYQSEHKKYALIITINR